MKGIANMPNIDTTDLANYPDGCIKDDPSGIAGTPIAKQTINDFYLLIDKMARLSGTTANNLLDNETNGYQTIQALFYGVNKFCAPIVLQMIGSSYSTSSVYVLGGCTTPGDSGIVFYNGTIYSVVGFTGAICGGGLVQVLSLVTGANNDFNRQMKVECGASGSGLGNWTTLVRTFGVTFDAWTNVVTYGTNFGSAGAGVVPRYTRNGQQQVYLMGSVQNTSGSPVSGGVMFTLPSGYRPTHDITMVSSSTNGFVVRTNGDVELTGTLAAGGGATLNFGSTSFLTV